MLESELLQSLYSNISNLEHWCNIVDFCKFLCKSIDGPLPNKIMCPVLSYVLLLLFYFFFDEFDG